jgi:hypothetical protein
LRNSKHALGVPSAAIAGLDIFVRYVCQRTEDLRSMVPGIEATSMLRQYRLLRCD